MNVPFTFCNKQPKHVVLGPLNSLLEESTNPNRYTAKAKFCFCKNNKRMIIICRRRARRSLVLVPVASPMVLPGIPDWFPETAHSVHAQRSRVEETDRIPAADEGSRAHPPTPTAPAPRAPAFGPPCAPRIYHEY